MTINQTASTIMYARALLMSLDMSKQLTYVATPTLHLLLSTLIDLGERDNPTARKVENAQASLVASRISGVERR